VICVCRLKWKPPSENSIDFKLVLRFPPSLNNPREPDYHAKPFFLLHIWHGGERNNAKYELYDYLNVTDEEWEAYVSFLFFQHDSLTHSPLPFISFPLFLSID
jgi:hypothetical protein